MSHRRPAKRRRLYKPRPHLLAFSSFARFSQASKARVSIPSPVSESSEHGLIDSSPSKAAERLESSDEDDDHEEEEQQEVDVVQADFGFFDPKPHDFNGVKLLLQNYLDDKPWDLSGFTDLILEQTTVGTVVKSEGHDDEEGEDGDVADEGLFAVISALNLGRYMGHRCIVELKEFLLEACKEESAKKKLELLLGAQARDVGLLVSQRFVNCPHQLVPPLYDALFDEVSWATEDEPTEEIRNFFRYKFYLLVTRIYVNESINKHKGRLKRDADEPVIYIKAEDEIFRELSSLSFTFHLKNKQLDPPELKNYREMGLVMVVKAEDIPKFREKLKSLLAES